MLLVMKEMDDLLLRIEEKNKVEEVLKKNQKFSAIEENGSMASPSPQSEAPAREKLMAASIAIAKG